MNLDQLPSPLSLHSRQNISVWEKSLGRRVNLDSLFLGVDHDELSRFEDCAEFLTVLLGKNQIILQKAAYNFRLYAASPESIELKNSLWIFPMACGYEDIFSEDKAYDRYLSIARATKLL